MKIQSIFITQKPPCTPVQVVCTPLSSLGPLLCFRCGSALLGRTHTGAAVPCTLLEWSPARKAQPACLWPSACALSPVAGGRGLQGLSGSFLLALPLSGSVVFRLHFTV